MSFSIKPSSFRTVSNASITTLSTQNISSENISVSLLEAGGVSTTLITPPEVGDSILINGASRLQGQVDVFSNINVYGGNFTVQDGHLRMIGSSDPATDIATPQAGILAYNTTNNTLLLYNGTSWLTVTAA